MSPQANESVLKDWVITDYDRELFERELATFVPPQIFDAHVHIYTDNHFAGGQLPEFIQGGPAEAGATQFERLVDGLIPGRCRDGLLFGFPQAEMDIDAANEFVAKQVSNHRRSQRFSAGN